MIKRILAAGMIATAMTSTADAQFVTASGQNYINRFSVAPAFAGFNGNHEGFIGYRSYMSGIDGATKLMTADVNGSLGGNMGYGVQIINEKSGNFNNMFAALTYAYHVELGTDMNLSFAISPTVIRSAYDLAGAKTYSSTLDPVFANEAGLSGTGFDAGFSLMFNVKGLYFSLYTPRLICQDLKYQNGIANYDRTFYGTISYAIEADKWEFDPIADVVYAMDGGLDWRGSIVAKYNKRAWVNLSYCSQKWIGMGAGFSATNRICVNYQYEMGTSDIAKSCNGTHEISVGFLIAKSDRQKNPTIFYGEDDAPAKSSKKDNALEKKLQDEIKTRDAEIKRLENMIKAAQANGTLSKPTTSTNEAAPTVSETNPTPPPQMDETVPPPPPAPEDKPNPKEWDQPQQVLNVAFGAGSSKLEYSSNPGIDAFVILMKGGSDIVSHDYETKRIMITVFTDGRGSDAYNKQLAKERAEAIKAYMVSKGIDGSRIVTVGAGGMGSNASDTESRFAANRVEACWSRR